MCAPLEPQTASGEPPCGQPAGRGASWGAVGRTHSPSQLEYCFCLEHRNKVFTSFSRLGVRGPLRTLPPRQAVWSLTMVPFFH